jgi:ADP-ribosylglycohydrolase
MIGALAGDIIGSVYEWHNIKTKGEIKEFIETTFHYDLSTHVDEIRPTYAFDESCQGTVPRAGAFASCRWRKFVRRERM